MDNKEFGKLLEIRTKKFAISNIKLSISLPAIPKGKVVKYQLTKADTSVGVNYREANRSRSKADFSNKIKVCESEASETSYWLEIIDELGWINSEVIQATLKESNELMQFLLQSAKT